MRKSEVDEKNKSGDVDEAFKNAARVIEAEYEWPFQSHACMGPACAVVEIKDGEGDGMDRLAEDALCARRRRRNARACRPDKVRAIWVTGPGCYGRNDAGDAAMDAAVIAKATGRAGARAIYPRTGHRLGPERPGLGA